MCVFIYTLMQQCGHTRFQNVCECPIARGIAPTTQTRGDLTLSEPKFLFDTARSQSHTPESYSRIFACKKRKAIRPVPVLCNKCLWEKEQEAKKERQVQMEDGLAVPPRSWAGVGRSESSGSSVALLGAPGPSASSTASSLHNMSGIFRLVLSKGFFYVMLTFSGQICRPRDRLGRWHGLVRLCEKTRCRRADFLFGPAFLSPFFSL